MEKFLAFLFFLRLVVAGKMKWHTMWWGLKYVSKKNLRIKPTKIFTIDSMEDYSADLHYDITNFLINSFNEILQLAHPRIIKNSYDEFVLQHQPFVATHSEIVHSKNITFSKFVSDEEIISFLELDKIVINFNNNKYLRVSKTKKFSARFTSRK